MSSLSLYLLGYLVLVVGVAMRLHLAGVPDAWVAVAGVVLIGGGIITGVTRMRGRDASPME